MTEKKKRKNDKEKAAAGPGRESKRQRRAKHMQRRACPVVGVLAARRRKGRHGKRTQAGPQEREEENSGTQGKKGRGERGPEPELFFGKPKRTKKNKNQKSEFRISEESAINTKPNSKNQDRE